MMPEMLASCPCAYQAPALLHDPLDRKSVV